MHLTINVMKLVVKVYAIDKISQIYCWHILILATLCIRITITFFCIVFFLDYLDYS